MKRHRVKPNERVKLREADAQDTGEYHSQDEAAARTDALKRKLTALQERLFTEGTRSILIVLQGMDTCGKDGTIRHVMAGVNPQSCSVTSFKTSTLVERSHDFLWRIHAACPPKGHIGIFNRSHYEDVLITRVHGWITDDEVERRLQRIREFEAMLTEQGTRLLKFMLHVSKDEQKERLLARIDDPAKRWKFSTQDIAERKNWKRYQKAYEVALSASSTSDAPWFVVPADHKWYRNLVVADRLVNALEELDPHPQKVSGIDWKQIRRAVEAT